MPEQRTETYWVSKDKVRHDTEEEAVEHELAFDIATAINNLLDDGETSFSIVKHLMRFYTITRKEAVVVETPRKPVDEQTPF